MEGAQTPALPTPPGASRPGAVERASLATDPRQVLGARATQEGGPLTGGAVAGGPDAGGRHRRGTRPKWRGDVRAYEEMTSSSARTARLLTARMARNSSGSPHKDD